MAPGLRHAVELVTAKIKSADQGPGRSIVGIDRDKGTFDFGDLDDFPDSAAVVPDPHDRATAQAFCGDHPVGRPQGARDKLQSFAADFDGLTAAA